MSQASPRKNQQAEPARSADDPVGRTPGRTPGRPPIPAERFVDAALEIIDEHGVDALSMRAVARRLGSGTATLYRHFDSRADLLAQVVDRVLAEARDATDEVDPHDWRHELRTIAQSLFDALGRHRNVIPLLVHQIPTGEHAIAARERIVAILLDRGCPPELAAPAFATLARYILGFAIQYANEPDGGTVVSASTNLDPRRYPASAAIKDSVPVSLETEFAFGLDLLLSGLAQILETQ